jgi:hypothetical protein
MESSIECYVMAAQCERQAAEVKSEPTHQILLAAAAAWRRLGDQSRQREKILPMFGPSTVQ